MSRNDTLSSLFRQVNKYTNGQLNPHQRRVQSITANGTGGFANANQLRDKDILNKKSRKMPYAMLQGM